MRFYEKTMAIQAVAIVMVIFLPPVPAAVSGTPVDYGNGGRKIL